MLQKKKKKKKEKKETWSLQALNVDERLIKIDS